MRQGAEDLAHAAEGLASRLPEPLAPLARVAYNYRWSWLADGPETFEAIEPHRWDLCGANPVRLLQEARADNLARAAADAAFLERVAAVEQGIAADLARPPAAGPATADRPVAYLSAEFGVHPSLPVYSGGLGALAGDFLKESSDLAVPMVAVGLMYRQGYFRQRIDYTGWQQEYWVDTDPERLPAALVTGEDGLPITVTVRIRGGDVTAQIWRVDVGRVPLFLLDAERPENGRLARWITGRLYVGDQIGRLAQYVLLGIGGMRALERMGIEPGLVHLNEGHAAFATLEMAAQERARGASLADAFEAVRRRTVFTTHTPVPAGNDTYPPKQLARTLQEYVGELGLGLDELVALGRSEPESGDEPFGVTQFALRMSRAANGVSRRHGFVSREMWRPMWPELSSVDDVPIGYVTNGVHLPTWVGPPMRRLLDRHLGEDWQQRAADPATWEALDDISDADLWAVRQEQRATLVEFVRDRSVANRLAAGDELHFVEAAARAFDPDALTIGFARRIATYKRLRLIMEDPGRALGLLAGPKPIQLVLAGKAHPSDEPAKKVLQNLFAFKNAPLVAERVVFLHEYDLGAGARLVQGCDVWVNLPRPPLEASGTSGMKSAANGGLNLSVLDGWWDEAYDGTNGWSLSGEIDSDEAAQDKRDAARLYSLIEDDVIPTFYDRDADGVPRAWVARVRAALRTLSPAFSASRMVTDYVEGFYAVNGDARTQPGARRATPATPATAAAKRAPGG